MSEAAEPTGQVEHVDLLVIGSGAGGLSTAIRANDLDLDVLVVEATDKFGGNTAMSGGVCWVGNNPHMKEEGIEDSDEETLEYLRSITKGEVSDERLETYHYESKRMVDYLEKNSEVKFQSLGKYTDYYPEAPGGKTGGRSMECPAYDGSKLGYDIQALRKPHPQSQIMGLFGITARQAHTFLTPGIHVVFAMAWLMILYFFRFFKRRKYGRDTRLTAGNSLVARLRRSLQLRDVPLWLESPAKRLIYDGDKVVGAVVERNGKEIEVRASEGVVLAAGGFSRNQEMREKYQRHPIQTEWTAGSPANMGEGIKMGLDAGGKLDLMKEAWWTPVTLVPGSDLAWVLVVEKSLPHSCFVNLHGKRFTNEAAPYIDVVMGMYDDNDENNSTIPAYMVFDSYCRENFPIGPMAPGYAMPDKRVPGRIKRDFLYKAESLDELADKIGVKKDNFLATIERFNENAKKGIDPDFNRGESGQDRYYGDARVKPNPCLGPVEDGPFYAIKIYPGDLGTKGGLITDTSARVLREDDTPIQGLWAVGNCSSSVMGRTYPGAGGTIGPALTFGMLAAESAATARAAKAPVAAAE
jgi:3-oxosteroid 1-dehydrogenase